MRTGAAAQPGRLAAACDTDPSRRHGEQELNRRDAKNAEEENGDERWTQKQWVMYNRPLITIWHHQNSSPVLIAIRG